MFSYTGHCVCDQYRTARLDVVKQKASVPDCLINRLSSLRATLKEQFDLGERRAPLAKDAYVLRVFWNMHGIFKNLQCETCRGVGGSLLVNVYLSTGN